MHRSCRRVGFASRVLLTGLVEAARIRVTGVIPIDRHTNTTTVDIVVRFDGIVVAIPCSVIGIREIGLAPWAVELTVSVSVAGLREGNLTVRGHANDSFVAGFQIEEEPGVAAGASHAATGSLPIVSHFIPQSDSDCAVGSKGDRVIMAVGIAIAYG